MQSYSLLQYLLTFIFQPSTDLATTQLSPTCVAVDNLIANANLLSCSRTDTCSIINCSSNLPPPLPVFLVDLLLLPCQDPPAVHVIITDGRGTTIFNQVLDESERGINIGSGATLDIIVEQLDGAIGLEVKMYYSVYSII